MTAADIFGLVVSLLIFAYLVYALFRGERSRCPARASPRSSSTPSLLVALGYPLGIWMARVYTALAVGRALLRRARERLPPARPRRSRSQEQDWKGYGTTVLVFSVLFLLVLYAIQRIQGHLFLNPDHMKDVPSHLSLNTAASFITNTNWQFYGGEYTMSYLTQMAGLAVQNFVSAAVGIAVLAAVIRGLARRSSGTIGNFWLDLYRTLVYVLLPLASSSAPS